MSYPSYLEYRDTGLDWPSQIPSHWRTAKFKHLAQINNGRDYKEVEEDDGPYPVIGSGGEFARANDYLYEGESVLLGRKGTVDKPLYVKGAFWTVDTMFYTHLKQHTSGRFLYYLATTICFDRYSTNTALPSMAQEDLANIQIVAPDLWEQTQIARFLDHQTARIDALIAEQQRLIELLKEKRQAVISHAVTKGLDPDVEMKDSGVEWLGEVPAHWDVTRVKWVAKLESGHTPSKSIPEYWEDCDIPWVSLNDSKTLANNDYIEDTVTQINALGMANSAAHILPRGTVVFTRDATIGLTAITTRPMAVSQHLIAWVCNEQIVPEFLLFIFYAMEEELQRSTAGATIKTIGMPEVRKMVTTVPPVDEQRTITEHVFKRKQQLEKTEAEAESFIRLLSERRSAQISAAVTGKIDVRDWEPPSSETLPKASISEGATA
jgi:type I restriction enzyme S subunit